MINDNEIIKIEKALGIKLFTNVIRYLTSEKNYCFEGRKSGKTLAYCIKLALDNKNEIFLKDLYRGKHSDVEYGTGYYKCFTNEFLRIRDILGKAGFEVIKVINKSGKNLEVKKDKMITKKELSLEKANGGNKMREILFRGKDKLGNWNYGSLHIDTITGADKYHINSRISVNNPKFVEVIKETVGQLTDSKDIDGNDIYEGDLVNQKSVIIDEDIDCTGYVKFYEGCWWIDNGEESVRLWSELRENKIM